MALAGYPRGDPISLALAIELPASYEMCDYCLGAGDNGFGDSCVKCHGHGLLVRDYAIAHSSCACDNVSTSNPHKTGCLTKGT